MARAVCLREREEARAASGNIGDGPVFTEVEVTLGAVRVRATRERRQTGEDELWLKCAAAQREWAAGRHGFSIGRDGGIGWRILRCLEAIEKIAHRSRRQIHGDNPDRPRSVIQALEHESS